MMTNVRDWFEQRSFSHEDFAALGTPGQAPREVSTTLIFPTRNVAGDHRPDPRRGGPAERPDRAD